MWKDTCIRELKKKASIYIYIHTLACLVEMSIMMKMENERRRYRHRLVVVPGPFQGHMTPMLQLATVLHSKGFSITIVHSTLFNPPDPSNHPSDFVFLPLISDGLSEDHDHVSSVSSDNIATITSNLNANCVTPLEQLLLRYLKHNDAECDDDDDKIACIIYDGLMCFVDSVARKLNLPTILLRTTSATNVLAYHSLPHLQSHASLLFQGISIYSHHQLHTHTLHNSSRHRMF